MAMTKKYTIEEVLPYVEYGRKSKKEFDGDMIKMTSQRLQLFKEKGTKCVCCGIEGQYFRKHRAIPTENYHFNLYALDESGKEMLMTKDHIVPKCKGGKNHISNYQTMCAKCNEIKGGN